MAVVVMAETLLSENNFAFQNGYKIKDNREILACAVGNFGAAVVGCCPVNGSISRTSMNDQYGGKTQLVSITASLTMVCVLLFGTGFIGYLPVPVLTAIVISALMKVVEFDLAVRLFRVSRIEFYIYMAAFFGVLMLGTIYGVIIGIILSFVEVILRETDPPRCFWGLFRGGMDFMTAPKIVLRIRSIMLLCISSVRVYFLQMSKFLWMILSKVLRMTQRWSLSMPELSQILILQRRIGWNSLQTVCRAEALHFI